MVKTEGTEENLRTSKALSWGRGIENTLRWVDEEPVRDTIAEIAKTRLMKERRHNRYDRVVEEDPIVKIRGLKAERPC